MLTEVMFENLRRQLMHSFAPKMPTEPQPAITADSVESQRPVTLGQNNLRQARSTFAETTRLTNQLRETTGLTFGVRAPKPPKDETHETSTLLELDPRTRERLRAQFASTTSLAVDARQRIESAQAQPQPEAISNSWRGEEPAPMSPQAPLNEQKANPISPAKAVTLGAQKLRFIRKTFAETRRLTAISNQTIKEKTGYLPKPQIFTVQPTPSQASTPQDKFPNPLTVDAAQKTPLLSPSGKVNADPTAPQVGVTLDGSQLKRIRHAFATTGWSSAH